MKEISIHTLSNKSTYMGWGDHISLECSQTLGPAEEEEQQVRCLRDPNNHGDRRNHHRKCMARVPTVSE
jgi:hypothetical protein